MSSSREEVIAALALCSGEAARTWMATVARAESAEALGGLFARAARAVRPPAAATDRGDWTANRASALHGTWRPDHLARALVLLRAAERLEDPVFLDLVEALYSRGDVREREAVLKSLPLLPGPDRFRTLATTACRTHVQPVFEAIACENPYPAAWFPAPAFEQLVLKCLFVGVAVARVMGLDERRTPELVRMARALASERIAAGRPVSADVVRISNAGRSP